MNYFKFYNIPISFKVDKAALKKIFYANSKKYHPDFFTLDSDQKKQEVLELSSLNNKAFTTLSDPDKRIKYVLELKGLLAEDEKLQLPQDFLMEMMDVNEKLMELEFEFDINQYQDVKKEIETFENSIFEEVKGVIENYDDTKPGEAELNKVKTYYLKKRYLLRILENLSKFASR